MDIQNNTQEEPKTPQNTTASNPIDTPQEEIEEIKVKSEWSARKYITILLVFTFCLLCVIEKSEMTFGALSSMVGYCINAYFNKDKDKK